MSEAAAIPDPFGEARELFSLSYGQGKGDSHPLWIILSPDRTVEGNLSIDEALTRGAAQDGRRVLRLWWGGVPTVVTGRSEKPEVVADLEACRRLGVRVLQRASGGGTVLQTPNVLNYSLTGPAPAMLEIRGVFRLGARLLCGALARLGLQGEMMGISDVAVGELKISGNAMAKRWGGLLLHGTLLRDLDMEMVERCLRHPPREPDYRQGRNHRAFLTTLQAEGVHATRGQIEGAFVASAEEMVAEGALEGFPFE